MNTTNKAISDGMPPIFADISVVARAKLRIHTQAKTMSIEISLEELQKFGLLLVAIEQE